MPEKIRCLVVDDEPLAIEALVTLLTRIGTVEIAGTCKDSFEAFSFLREHTIDLMFLDISMPEMSGMELLRSLTDPPAVIMTTAHREYAVEAFDLDVVDYLLKPISAERLLKAISRFINQKQGIQTLADQPAPGELGDSSLMVRADRKFRKLDVPDILYVEGLKDYVKIHLENEVVITRMTLQEVEGRLPKDAFIRTHRSFIVNRNRVTAITRHDVEIGNTEIPIGKSYRESVSDSLGLDEQK